MKVNERKRGKEVYLIPHCQFVPLQVESLLDSVSGQHQNASSNGNHGDAKASGLWDEDFNEQQND